MRTAGSPTHDAPLLIRIGRVLAGRHFPVSPWAAWRHFARHKDLILRLTRRDVMGRYDGSYLGIVWSVLTPLLLLAIYTFVFSVVFHARWGSLENEGAGFYAITLYASLVAFFIFSEVAAAAPQIITRNPNYVTRVVFPLEVLPAVQALAAVARAVPSVVVLAGAVWWVLGRIPPTFALLPLVLVPMVLLALGAAYFLAFLGVFVRDTAHSMTLVIRVITYLSPVFYPVTRLPERVRPIAMLNPIACVVENCRRVAVFGQPPDWPALAGATALAGLVAWASYLLFMSFKKAFADVL